MVERVRITPTLMRLKDASGEVVFDTNNRYIITESPGELNLAQSSPAPYPLNANQINYSMGTLVYLRANLGPNDTYSVEFTPAVDGFFSVHPRLGIGGGSEGFPAGIANTDQDIVTVSQGGTKIWSRKISAIYFFGGIIGPITAVDVRTSLHGDAVGVNEAIAASAGITYRFHKDSTSMTANNGAFAYITTGHTIAIHFFTGVDTLPLKVTV